MTTIRPFTTDPTIVSKPWGREIIYCVTEHYAVKILCITKGHRLSLQKHNQKEESWYFLKGLVHVIYGGDSFTAAPGKFVHVPPNTIHRLEALEDAEILEVSTPQLDDIVRLEDDYSRK